MRASASAFALFAAMSVDLDARKPEACFGFDGVDDMDDMTAFKCGRLHTHNSTTS
jgi:hypothetical protein